MMYTITKHGMSLRPLCSYRDTCYVYLAVPVITSQGVGSRYMCALVCAPCNLLCASLMPDTHWSFPRYPTGSCPSGKPTPLSRLHALPKPLTTVKTPQCSQAGKTTCKLLSRRAWQNGNTRIVDWVLKKRSACSVFEGRHRKMVFVLQFTSK